MSGAPGEPGCLSPRSSLPDGTGDPRTPARRVRVLHLLAFLALLSVWTWKLLEPNPIPPPVNKGLGEDLKFYIGKTLHAGMYAVLAVLGTTLSRRWRWWVVGFLLLHAIGTEVGQAFVPNRTGKVADVLIDWAGIAVGLLAVRRIAPRRAEITR